MRYREALDIIKNFDRRIVPDENGSYAKINAKTRLWSRAKEFVRWYRLSRSKNRKGAR